MPRLSARLSFLPARAFMLLLFALVALGFASASPLEAQLPTPSLSPTPQPGDRWDVSQCVADCFEQVLTYALPTYVSKDVARTTAIQYRSGRAHPYGRVELDATIGTSVPPNTIICFQLLDPNGQYVTWSNGSTNLYLMANPNGTTRLAGEFDAGGVSTGRYVYTAIVTYQNHDDGSQVSQTVYAYPGVIIVNDQNSPYGAGVEVVGLQRLFFNQSGGTLATDGTGSATFFYGSCATNTTCTFTTAAGDFSTLKTVGNGTYVRTYPDGTVITFNSAGYETQAADRFGNATTYTYTWNSQSGMYALQQATDPAGYGTVFDYQIGDMPSWRTGTMKGIYQYLNAVGHYAYFAVDWSNNLVEIEDVDSVYFGYPNYDSLHRMIEFTDRNGNYWHYGYGGDGGSSGVMKLDHIDAPPVTINASMQSPHTSLREPSGDILYQEAAGLAGWNSYLPYWVDLRAQVTTPRGYTTNYTTNRYGAPTKIEDPVGGVATNEYNADLTPV